MSYALKAWIIASTVYFVVVIGCIYMAFDYEGSIEPSWTIALIALTLPGSVISILFGWSLVHGAGLGFFTFVYLLKMRSNKRFRRRPRRASSILKRYAWRADVSR